MSAYQNGRVVRHLGVSWAASGARSGCASEPFRENCQNALEAEAGLPPRSGAVASDFTDPQPADVKCPDQTTV